MDPTIQVVFQGEIRYPWKPVAVDKGYWMLSGAAPTSECPCMASRVSINLEDITIRIKIIKNVDPKSNDNVYIATIEEIPLVTPPHRSDGEIHRRILPYHIGIPFKGRLLRNVSVGGRTPEAAYMNARSHFLQCRCKNPENELYDLGYEKPQFSFWNIFTRK